MYCAFVGRGIPVEKRDKRRKKVRLTVFAEPGSIRAYTADLGYGGIFLVTTKVHQPGSRIRLVVRDYEGKTALGVGVIRWSKRIPPSLIRATKGGMGVEFTWVSPELQALVDSIMGG
jgi:Tfp pilus assembly protein PilZ